MGEYDHNKCYKMWFIEGLRVDGIRRLTSMWCFLDSLSEKEEENQEVKNQGSVLEEEVCMVLLEAKNCRLWCQTSPELRAQVRKILWTLYSVLCFV